MIWKQLATYLCVKEVDTYIKEQNYIKGELLVKQRFMFLLGTIHTL